MKKLIATALALLLAMTPAAMAEPEYAPRITEAKQPLPVMRYIRDIDNIQMDGLWYNDHMEELTNVHIDYTTVSQSDFPMQLNLMYSSGEYPDLVIDGGNNVDLEMYGVDQGVFMPRNRTHRRKDGRALRTGLRRRTSERRHKGKALPD